MFLQSINFLEITTNLSMPGITIVTSKTKAIEALLGVFTYLGIFIIIIRHIEG